MAASSKKAQHHREASQDCKRTTSAKEHLYPSAVPDSNNTTPPWYGQVLACTSMHVLARAGQCFCTGSDSRQFDVELNRLPGTGNCTNDMKGIHQGIGYIIQPQQTQHEFRDRRITCPLLHLSLYCTEVREILRLALASKSCPHTSRPHCDDFERRISPKIAREEPGTAIHVLGEIVQQ